MSDAANRPLRVGMTGGIASGKSTVGDMFAELGAPIIDTDLIARDVVAPGQPALDEIRQAFGADVFRGDGSLDRAALRNIVFADSRRRHKLEAILHPRIRDAALQQAAAAGGNYQIIVVPLLVESSLRTKMDRILVVDCNESVQIQRLMERDAESEGQARRMLAAQSGRAERLAIADDVIHNDGDLETTREQVNTLHTKYSRKP